MEIIHALNRGVDKRKIFLDQQDYFRFIHDLFEFNDQERVDNSSYLFRKFRNNKSIDIASRYIRKERRPRKKLVDIHVFCIMRNHYHLLLSPRVDRGVSKFMKKLNMGYSKYFNEKYERQGTLFEGRYKSVAVKSEAHFIHLPYYIHLNPLDQKFPQWRRRELRDYRKAMKFLESYRWSSHLDYLGKENFPSVTKREFLMDFFGGAKGYKSSIRKWLKDIDLEEIKNIALE